MPPNHSVTSYATVSGGPGHPPAGDAPQAIGPPTTHPLPRTATPGAQDTPADQDGLGELRGVSAKRGRAQGIDSECGDCDVPLTEARTPSSSRGSLSGQIVTDSDFVFLEVYFTAFGLWLRRLRIQTP
jgi:hypothetical protein